MIPQTPPARLLCMPATQGGCLALRGRESLTCIVGVHVGPAKGDARERVVKIADGPAVCRQRQVVLRADNALEQVRMAPVDLGQADGQVLVVDAVETNREVLV